MGYNAPCTSARPRLHLRFPGYSRSSSKPPVESSLYDPDQMHPMQIFSVLSRKIMSKHDQEDSDQSSKDLCLFSHLKL
jgi:hypothetical protein